MIQQRIAEPIVDEPVPLAEFVGVWEQIVDVLVPLTMEDDVGVVRSLPLERVQNRVLEQITEFTQFLGERVQNRTMDQTAVFRVPRILEAAVEVVPSTPQGACAGAVYGFPCASDLEAVVEVVPSTPQECVQNRTRKLFVGVPAPHIMEKTARKVKCTGKAYTVPHHRYDRLAHWILWVSTSRATSSTCLELEM